MIDLAAFETWLKTRKGRNNRPFPTTTVGAYVKAARAIAERGEGAARHSVLLGAARQLQLWPDCPKEYAPLLEKIRSEGAAPPKRTFKAKSIPEKSWLRYVRALEGFAAKDASAAVLLVLADTGLRIGDVLRIPVAELRNGKRTGRLDLTVKGRKERIVQWDGAENAWETLLSHATRPSAQIVAHLVVPGSSPIAGESAYKACAKTMATIGAQIDPAERWHLHRMRRTVLVRALDETGNISAVAQLALHESILTTQRYLDEVRSKETAALSRKLITKRRG